MLLNDRFYFILCNTLISICSFSFLSMRSCYSFLPWKNPPQNQCVVSIKKKKLLLFCSVTDSNDIQCSVDTSGQRWTCSSGQRHFGCSVDDSGHRILCLDKQHCPYTEESQQIHISVYVKTEHFLVENYSKHFYLSEIGETSPGDRFLFLYITPYFHVLVFLVFLLLSLFSFRPVFCFYTR